jgi:hypothetical protein
VTQLCLSWLNEAGIGLAMTGGLVIFRWGPPQPSFQDYVSLAVEPATRLAGGGTAADVARDAEKQKHFYQCMAHLGLGLIIVGFALQAVANFPPLQLAAG